MQTEFVYHPANEYERLVIVMQSLVSGHYRQGDFLVLPRPITHHPKSVFLPRIPGFSYSTHHTAIAELAKSNILTDFDQNPLAGPVLRAIKQTGFRPQPINRHRTNRVEQNWYRVQAQLEDYLLETFPQFRSLKIHFEVRWTHYGTLVSFRLRETIRNRLSLTVYVRDDMGVTQIAEGFFSSLFGLKMKRDYAYSWPQREAIIDFIFLETKFRRLFPDYCPTLEKNSPTKDNDRLLHESRAYLHELGLANKPALSLKDQKVWIRGVLPKIALSPSEEALLSKLLLSGNTPVSYYELGDVLWKDNPDNFSLWALARMVYKIRRKLKFNNLPEDIIKNKRGYGYFAVLN